MPSGKPNMPEEGFRRQAWGFNRDDVLAYVNALVNEAQQQQLTYEEQVRQLQAQVDKLKKDQANARACVEKLQSDLLQQTGRADRAEQQLADCQDQLKVAESRVTGNRDRYLQSQKTLLEWQNKCHELEQQLESARTAAAQAAVDTAAAPEPPAEPPAAEPAALPEPPAPLPEPEPPVRTPEPESVRPAAGEPATVEARKILADARIYADAAARRMRREAEEQKARMAENARDLAAGVLVLRERLNRVDEKLSAATLDLENATAAIYAALDDTDADLKNLGLKMDAFAAGTPETDEPEPPAPPEPSPRPAPQPSAEPEPASARPAAAARRVRPVARAKQPPKPAPPVRRLRSVQDTNRRAVAQSLLDAINRLDADDEP